MNANDVTTCIYVYACVRIIIYCVYVSSYTCTYNHKYVEVSSYVHHNDVITCIYTSLIINMTSDVYTRIRTQAPACIVYACDELRVYTWGYQLCVYTWGYELHVHMSITCVYVAVTNYMCTHGVTNYVCIHGVTVTNYMCICLLRVYTLRLPITCVYMGLPITCAYVWYRVTKTREMLEVAGRFFAKEPLMIGLLCGKWPVKIRHPMGLRHPVSYVYTRNS